MTIAIGENVIKTRILNNQVWFVFEDVINAVGIVFFQHDGGEMFFQHHIRSGRALVTSDNTRVVDGRVACFMIMEGSDSEIEAILSELSSTIMGDAIYARLIIDYFGNKGN
jgi:hypothetical protein